MSSWYQKSNADWVYTLTQALGYHLPELGLPDMDMRTLAGKLIATVRSGWLIIHEGYSWDGCSVIGRVIETDGTLHASCLHDLLYQLAEQGATFAVPYEQKQADQAFKRYLPWWARWIWYGGVRVFGSLYYGDDSPSLSITLK